MPHQLHANIDLSHLEEPELSVALDKIFNSLTDNAVDFPALPVPLLTYGGQISAYKTVLGKPIYPSRTGDLLAALTTVLASTRDNGVSVNQVAKGNLSLLEKSGYPISKPHLPVGILSKGILIVTPISHGFNIEILNADPHAAGFLFLYVELTGGPIDDDFHKWPWHFLPKHKGSITTLKPLTKYRMMVVGLGTDPTLVYSDYVERATQE